MDEEHWKQYFSPDVVARAGQLRTTATIESAGDSLHADVYAREPGAPVVLFNHGSVGYCRMFAGLALRFHERGYTFVALDQRGNGYSSGRRGDLIPSMAVMIDASSVSQRAFPATSLRPPRICSFSASTPSASIRFPSMACTTRRRAASAASIAGSMRLSFGTSGGFDCAPGLFASKSASSSSFSISAR